MTLPDITVDLNSPPAERWRMEAVHQEGARRLLRMYNDDLGVDDTMLGIVAATAPAIVPPALLAEMEGIAAGLDVSLAEVLVANLHYDLLKVVLGCTAFAVDSENGPLHARNLDWWTTSRALNDATLVTRFLGGPAGEFLSVGWPGFVGAFSGMAKGRFAVSLNAVLSDEAMQVARPVVMLVREVLEEAATFDEAVSRLSDTTVAMDCLLLVTGTEPGEMVVIERTPTRFAHRTDAPLHVTNDYISIDADTGVPTNELMRSSCGRFERTAERLSDPPTDLAGCIELLRDPQVMLGITVQQMAFRARTGEVLVRVP